MTLHDWSALGEVVSAIAVVATLLYVGIQIKQAGRAIKVASAQTGAEFNGEVFQELISNPEFASLYLKGGAEGLPALEASERLRFLMLCNKAMRYFEHMYRLHRSDALPPGFWQGQEKSIQDHLSDRGSREAWEFNMHGFSVEFQQFVTTLPPGHSWSVAQPG